MRTCCADADLDVRNRIAEEVAPAAIVGVCLQVDAHAIAARLAAVTLVPAGPTAAHVLTISMSEHGEVHELPVQRASLSAHTALPQLALVQMIWHDAASTTTGEQRLPAAFIQPLITWPNNIQHPTSVFIMLIKLRLRQHVTAVPTSERDELQQSRPLLVFIRSGVGLAAASLVLWKAGAVGVAAEAGVVGLAHPLQIAGLCTGSSTSRLAADLGIPLQRCHAQLFLHKAANGVQRASCTISVLV